MAAKGQLNIAIILNCQGFMLAKCMEFLLPNISFNVMVPPQFAKECEENPKFTASYPKKYDYYILRGPADDFLKQHKMKIDKEKLIELPSFKFAAYHPDPCVLATKDGKTVSRGTLKELHSSLVYKSYRHGLSQADIAKLFNEKTYQDIGYMDEWDYEKAGFLKRFGIFDFNMEGYVEKWGRQEAFMFIFNHPKIECLFDLAKEIIKKFDLPPGMRMNDYNAVCPIEDDLKKSFMYPVYTEIAENYGVRGSYCFKLPGSHKTATLQEFIANSVAIYDELGDEAKTLKLVRESRVSKNIDQYLSNY